MKAIKIIIWLIIGFGLGISFFPLKYWIEYRNFERGVSSCDTLPKEELIPLVKQGDINAYDELRIYFSCKENPEELLPYALLMANKYNDTRAYFDVYYCFWYMFPETTDNLCLLDSLDSTTKNIALEYLQKGAELGEINSQQHLGSYYFEGKYFEKDTVLGKKLIDRSWGK